MEKSTNRELWVVYRHPVNKTLVARWFSSDEMHTARQKAIAFIGNPHECIDGKIIEGAQTASQAIKGYR